MLRWAENPRSRLAGFRVAQLVPGIGAATAKRLLDAQLHLPCRGFGECHDEQLIDRAAVGIVADQMHAALREDRCLSRAGGS